MHAVLSSAPDRLDGGNRRSERNLLERRSVERRLEWDALAGVLREGHARLPHLAQALRPEPRERCEPGKREQGLVGGDVRRRLLATDVLLASLQGEDEGAPAVRVHRLPDDAPRHAADELASGGKEPVVRAAVGGPVAGRLSLAECDVAAVRARSFQHPERHQIDVRDGERPGLPGRLRQIGSRFEVAEEVRLLEEDGGGIRRCGTYLVGVGHAVPVRNLDHLEAEARRIGLHDLADLGVQRLGEHDLPPLGDVPRDEAGVGRHGRAVVSGRVRDVHSRQLADDRLVLEHRLQHPLAHLRLVRRVRREELAAREHDVGDRRHVVVVDASAEERELGARVDVSRRELLDVTGELRLTQRGRQIELAPEPNAGRDLLEELLDGRDPDRREHLLAIRVGDGEVAHGRRPTRANGGKAEGDHCSATCARYAVASINASTSAGSDMRIRRSQPSP